MTIRYTNIKPAYVLHSY
uniref:Uncharacterized protein n=1 Tax=Rhizophora mucronata TaxID=61149 RepID=A0A2P2P5L2_RHIMU